MTQREIKQLYGGEIAAYARANSILKPVEEHNRCWRVPYSDEVPFHLDTLPCVPEEPAEIQLVVSLGVPASLAGLMIAITDRRHPDYDRKSSRLLSSNPRGFAAWLRTRLGRRRLRGCVNSSITGSISR